MKSLLILTAACISFAATNLHSGQTATTRMFCLSPRLGNGAGPFGLYSLDLTSIGNSINGELFPVYSLRTHFSYIILHDDIFDEDVEGYMFLDVPSADINNNGFDDFFEVALPCSGGTSGNYSLPGENGLISATWSRNAGSYAGTCQIILSGFGTFTHTFNILEYNGVLTYTPGADTVSGNINFALSGVPASELQGPLSCTKSVNSPFNELTMDGSWTNSSGQVFPFTIPPVIERDSFWPTNYYGVVEFDDWYLDTFEPDYYLWMISIDDLNDSDGDGIPDFSDTPQTVIPRPPQLSLERSAGGLKLTISGDVGTACDIMEASSITATLWPTVLSVTLTNDPQAITLPAPSAATKFWRVTAH